MLPLVHPFRVFAAVAAATASLGLTVSAQAAPIGLPHVGSGAIVSPASAFNGARGVPHIGTLSQFSGMRSDRILIYGTNLGVRAGRAHVEIGGLVASVTRWSDTLIAAYIPGRITGGTVNVRVLSSNGLASNVAQLRIMQHAAQNARVAGDHILWRFKADADYIQSRPAVGPDGTVYAIDVYGHLYALTPNGTLKWVFNAPGSGFGNVTVGADGTVYTGSTSSIFALAPDGTLKWQFDQTPAALFLLGPNVGPDGNIYAIGTSGLGVFSLTPAGNLRWAIAENFARPLISVQDIVFTTSPQPRLFFHANHHVRSVSLDGQVVYTYDDGIFPSQGDSQPAVGSNGTLYTNLFNAQGAGILLGKLDASGSPLWAQLQEANVLSTAEIGRNGTVYDARNLSYLYAVTPSGKVRWQYADPYIILSNMPSPTVHRLLLGGMVTYGEPGFFEGVSTSGKSLWNTILPVENGLNIIPWSRARFSADGKTAYVGTSIPGQSGNGYCYVYSVRV